MEKENKRRYFFFVYSFWAKEYSGKGSLYANGINFPNKLELEALAIKSVEEKYYQYGFRIDVVIENWIEMTEEDYNNFLSKK